MRDCVPYSIDEGGTNRCKGGLVLVGKCFPRDLLVICTLATEGTHVSGQLSQLAAWMRHCSIKFNIDVMERDN